MEDPESIAMRAERYYSWRIITWIFGDLYPELAFQVLIMGGKYRTAERFYAPPRGGATGLAFVLYRETPGTLAYQNATDETMLSVADQWQLLLDIVSLRDLPHVIKWFLREMGYKKVLGLVNRMSHFERRALVYRILQCS